MTNTLKQPVCPFLLTPLVPQMTTRAEPPCAVPRGGHTPARTRAAIDAWTAYANTLVSLAATLFVSAHVQFRTVR